MMFYLVYGSDLFLKDGENAGIRYFEVDCKDAATCEPGLAGEVSEPCVVLRHCFEMHEVVAFLLFFSIFQTGEIDATSNCILYRNPGAQYTDSITKNALGR